MEDNGDNVGSKLSKKGNGSAKVGAKQGVHDTQVHMQHVPSGQ